MRRSLLVLIISILSSGALASGYALWTYVLGDGNERAAVTATVPTGESARSAQSGASKVAGLTPPASLPAGASGLLAIEVARIDASGPSVLAGRSPPNHKVTLLANGREIATVTATDEGQWAAVIDEGIRSGPLELSITSQPKGGGTTLHGAPRQLVVPPASTSVFAATAPSKSAPKTDTGAPPRAASVPTERPDSKGRAPAPASAQAKSDEAAGKRALAEFEALVERTRKEMAGQRAAGQPAKTEAGQSAPAQVASTDMQPRTAAASAETNATSPSASTETGARAAGAPASTLPSSTRDTRLAASMPPSTAIAAPPTIAAPTAIQARIPVPITFVSNQAALTSDGERAASLLAEYLRLKQPASIALSGHADARGPDGYNMRLSLRRLEAIERYLRAAGYSGQLSLLPRGKREPYAGIDRKRLPLREIYQADRRVELHLTP